MSYRERQRLAEIEAAIDAMRSHMQRDTLADRRVIQRSPCRLPAQCVARATRFEEDGFAGGPSVGCVGGPLP